MTIEQIRQQLIDEGKNPDDYSILIHESGYSVWKKEVAPVYMKASEQIAKQEDRRQIEDIEITADTVVFLLQKIQDLESRLEELEND